MKISLGGYSFCSTLNEGKMDIFGYLESVKYRYHLDTVDLWNGFFAKLDEDQTTLNSEDDIKKIREALDEREMTVVNHAVDGAHLWDPDPEKRERLYQNALDHLKASEMLGARTVRIDVGGQDVNHMSDEQFDYVVSRYREYCERAAEHGYMVGPENHFGPAVNPHFLKRIAEAVNHPNFGILLHINRWKVDQAEGNKIVAPWVNHTHFDAATVTSDNAVQVVRTLVDAGYDGYWAVEHNGPGNQYIEVEWAIAAVKRVMKAAGLS